MTRTLSVLAASDAPVEAIWRRLADAARPSYFLSWGWIESWLACLPAEQRPELAVVADDGVPVAACFLRHRRILRHHVVPSDALFMNATGVETLDELCAEHNGLLRMPDAGVSIGDLVALLLPASWDELHLSAIDRDTLPASTADYRVVVDREAACPYIDLARVRAAPGGYESLLGSATRAQVRRARRRAGELRVEIARDAHEAIEIYDELVRLHTASWQARGQPGAFADPWFDRFHRRLIAQRFDHGEIQLIRVSSATTLGCIYNFVSAGRVEFYQSGLAISADAKDKPGYVCHAAAIEHAARAGHAIYDLLGGDARYKQSLSTDETHLVWARVQRHTMRFAIEDRLRQWRQAARRRAVIASSP